MKKGKIYYYKDELNDDFCNVNVTPRKIDKNYKYIHKNIFWNVISKIVQLICLPIGFIYIKGILKIKYIGKEKLKAYKKTGYFLYVNHTQIFADTTIPTMPIYPRKNFFIVNPKNISIKPFRRLVEMLGAIPIPDDKEAAKNFLEAIKVRIQNNNVITIYPEAHIWPYYTKIRPFKAVSFRYPIMLDVPTFCMTNTYQAYGKNKKKLKMVTYIDGPFLKNTNLNLQEQKEDLKNQVYNCMVERSKNNNIEYIKYEKISK